MSDHNAKIAIYSIAKNEEKFVERWFNSCADADYILLVDTGSTDNTVSIAESLGIYVRHISVQPWRFDDARNAALALLPADIDCCIPLDLDEVLVPGWRGALEREISKGVNRPRYKYVWSWRDGKPDIQFYGDKIHARRGFRWRHPVHEVITSSGVEQIESFSDDIQIHHFPDDAKSRGQYFDLLKLSIKEDPKDDRNSFYYARELFYHGQFAEAIEEFERFLTLSRWDAERAAAYRFMAKCSLETGSKIYYLKQAVKEANRREAWVDLALVYYYKKMWKECFDSVQKALTIEERPFDYISEAYAWDGTPYDIGAVAAYNNGDTALALEYTKFALQYSPIDERLLANLEFLEQQ
jgi:glycosyltransferase involved in cell wall biosynthesis